MLPIPGTSRVSHLEENVAAASVSIDEQRLLGLERLVSRASASKVVSCPDCLPGSSRRP
jgi:aryl-alcohol dehydrogenase-like predicted oxidoreductase